MKLSQAQEDAGAKTLKKLRDKIIRSGKREPACLIVLTATGFAHKREDGVFSIPIGCMRP
ncbi:MAG: hypothetical protein K6G51_00115 [Sphaerochaetaceae bacterium]|nr:hypothetical protein [Sphaerochaetaceae bacterium]